MKQEFTLLKSKIRRKIFSLFFTNPRKRYYFRQLQRMMGGSPGSLLRELNYLVGSEILTDQAVGNLRFFQVNQKHPLFPELKKIVFKTEGVAGKIKESLLKIPKIKMAFIYGSFARGEESALSDVDLIIIGEPDLENLERQIQRLESWFGREINYSTYSDSEFSQRRKNKDFMMYVLNEPKIILFGEFNED